MAYLKQVSNLTAWTIQSGWVKLLLLHHLNTCSTCCLSTGRNRLVHQLKLLIERLLLLSLVLKVASLKLWTSLSMIIRGLVPFWSVKLKTSLLLNLRLLSLHHSEAVLEITKLLNPIFPSSKEVSNIKPSLSDHAIHQTIEILWSINQEATLKQCLLLWIFSIVIQGKNSWHQTPRRSKL